MNLDKVIELRDFIAEHPEHVNMGLWAVQTDCGTVACAAGHAALLDGVTMPPVPADNGSEWMINVETKTSRWLSYSDDAKEGEESPFAYGQRVLGLEYWTAVKLFLHTQDGQILPVLDRMIADERFRRNVVVPHSHEEAKD